MNSVNRKTAFNQADRISLSQWIEKRWLIRIQTDSILPSTISGANIRNDQGVIPEKPSGIQIFQVSLVFSLCVLFDIVFKITVIVQIHYHIFQSGNPVLDIGSIVHPDENFIAIISVQSHATLRIHEVSPVFIKQPLGCLDPRLDHSFYDRCDHRCNQYQSDDDKVSSFYIFHSTKTMPQKSILYHYSKDVLLQIDTNHIHSLRVKLRLTLHCLQYFDCSECRPNMYIGLNPS